MDDRQHRGHPTGSGEDLPAADVAVMRRALELAVRGPEADPNPRVGCVVTDAAGTVVGEGWHAGAGAPHAEVMALAAAGGRARGGTAHVTLEPCAHTGRTGPCTTALLDAGVARVVLAQADPTPEAGGGADTLRDTGVDVVGGVLAAESLAVNRSWTHLARTRLPWVTWKLAASLDGRVAAADGTSQWITGAEARRDVHAHRARCGAVLVGTGTVLADDPLLTARGPAGAPVPRQPLRVVMGERDIPAGARVLGYAAETLHVRTRDPEVTLRALAARGVHHVWLEGGPTLAAAFLAAGLVDEVVAYVAPVLIGRGRHVLTDVGVTTIADAIRLAHPATTRLGDDVRVVAALTEVS